MASRVFESLMFSDFKIYVIIEEKSKCYGENTEYLIKHLKPWIFQSNGCIKWKGILKSPKIDTELYASLREF